jgi:hypothetical protein
MRARRRCVHDTGRGYINHASAEVDMASVRVKVSTEQDAELALAGLWYEVEFYDLTTPNLTIEFGGISQIMFCVTIDGPEPAAHVLCAWSKAYSGFCLDSVRPSQSIDSSTFDLTSAPLHI